MQFLDAIGLASFWKKIKNWVNINYLSLTGGTIRGSVSFLNEEDGGKSIRIDPSNITNSRYGVNYLFASGKMIPIGEANGVAGLDANGNVPLAQLGNLDTTVAEVVTALPTTNIKKHIYLIKDASGVSQNQYEEYIYTGDTSATYDASKWEKLGDFRATVDLANYAKKNEAVGIIDVQKSANAVDFEYKDINGATLGYFSLEKATEHVAGVMSSADRNKLNGIANNANNYSLPTASSTIKGGITLGYSQNGKNYPVALDSNGKAYVNVPWIDTNTTYGLATSKTDGLMKASDKAKIDSIDTTYTKKSENIQHVNVNPDTTSNRNGVELEFTNVDEDPIVYAYIPEVTTMSCGVMNEHDKLKLDEIDSRATADSAIPTSVIDALK